MDVLQIVVGAVMLLLSLIIIVMVIFQQGRRTGIGAISGGADTFLSKKKAQTVDEKLPKITAVFAGNFFVLAVVAGVIAMLHK